MPNHLNLPLIRTIWSENGIESYPEFWSDGTLQTAASLIYKEINGKLQTHFRTCDDTFQLNS